MEGCGYPFLELGKVTLLEEKAVPICAAEYLILKVEIPHSAHGKRLACVRINEWPPVVMQGYNLREQSLVLHTVGNDQATTIKGSLMKWVHIHVLE